MSNTTEKLAIANKAMINLGHSQITAIDDSGPLEKKINSVFESVVKEMMADDWYFNRKQILLEDMTQIYKLTVDTAPSPAVWARGATITGASSAVTCTVVSALSDTVYLVTEPSGDFTDGEVLSDGTNSVDCAADYPESTEDIEIDQYQYGFREPTDCLHIRGIFSTQHDECKIEHKMYQNIVLSHYNEDFWFKYNYYRTASTDVSDVTGIKMWFHNLCSARLAFLMSANITENQKIRSKVELDYNNAYLEAKEKNGSEEGDTDWSGNDDWSEGANRELELNSYEY